MESNRLILEGGPRDAEWLLEGSDGTLVLKTPDGQLVLEAPIAIVHRVIDLIELYAEDKISFASAHGSLTFRKQPTALAALRELVEAGLAGDPEFRSAFRQHALRTIPRGLAMFIVGGGLFGLYCWYASWAPDPPPEHWIRWFGWLIHGVLLILMAVGLAGPILVCGSGCEFGASNS